MSENVQKTQENTDMRGKNFQKNNLFVKVLPEPDTKILHEDLL